VSRADRWWPRQRGDRGSASLWLLVVGLLLVAAGFFAATVGAATVARHRARTAADLGALAGARWALWGPATACAEAAAVVSANGARLVRCEVVEEDVVVAVDLTVAPLRGLTRTARARACAGPVRADATGSMPAGTGPPALFGLRDAPGSRRRRRTGRITAAKSSVEMRYAGRRWLDARRDERPAASGAPRGDHGRNAQRRVRMELSLATRTVAGHTVLDVGGEVDVYTAPKLRERLVELFDGGSRKIVVDLSRVDFLDSTGLGVLVGAFKRLRLAGGSFALVCAREPLLKIFRITALDQVFPLFDTVEAAVGADAGPTT
jgi:anti-sigma B factor antagonist